MTWDLEPAEREIVETVRRFCRDILAPNAANIDRGGIFAGAHRDKLAELGVMGLNLPEHFGGVGASPWALHFCLEAIAGACASTASMVSAHYLATDAILIGGNDEQRQRFLPKAASGEWLGAFALSEPAAGSNPADMTTKAERNERGYRISGVKHFISNAKAADIIVVFAKTDPTQGARGISAFVLQPNKGGVHVREAEPTMGLRGGHIHEIAFNCEVAEADRLGPEGHGFRVALQTLDNGRVDVGAMCCGIAEAALGAAVAWTKERKVAGRPLCENQGVQWMLADMAVDLAASRALCASALEKRAKGERFSLEAAQVKFFAAEMAGRVTDMALQLHGGYGYTSALPLERYARDVRIMRIYEGASEVQRNIIARAVLA
jgi:alkylation response protein AidB-like acyl-CoA dehydrogenase